MNKSEWLTVELTVLPKTGFELSNEGTYKRGWKDGQKDVIRER